MNIHPLFVHFPIALLTLYAVLELLAFKKIANLPYWFYLKALLAIVGALSAVVAIQTGELIEREFQQGGSAQLVETHSFWAATATYIFAGLAVCYLVAWLDLSSTFKIIIAKKSWLQSSWRLLRGLQQFIFQKPLLILLALAGLSALSITGALGGALAYGPNIDPVVAFVYKILIK